MGLYLGIESSCDETAVAIVEDGKNILINLIASQCELHAPFHGVVPELASRAHLQNIFPLLEEAFQKTGIKSSDLDGIGVTNRPGLLGALLVGVSTAKTLALTLKLPLYEIHHIFGHVYSAHLEQEINYPYISLVVSGGHTSLYLVKSPLELELLGKTIDDAAGESFDKVSKLLELGYPGGPIIDKLAKKGNPEAINFPRTMLKKKNLQFSFSGLKTSVLYKIFGQDQKASSIENSAFAIEDIAASFQEAVVDTLVQKSVQALKQHQLSTLTMTGGVACNSRLRYKMQQALEKMGGKVFYPSPILCTDNAAMIAGLTYHVSKTKSASLDFPIIPN